MSGMKRKDVLRINLVEKYKPLGLKAVLAATEVKRRESLRDLHQDRAVVGVSAELRDKNKADT